VTLSRCADVASVNSAIRLGWRPVLPLGARYRWPLNSVFIEEWKVCFVHEGVWVAEPLDKRCWATSPFGFRNYKEGIEVLTLPTGWEGMETCLDRYKPLVNVLAMWRAASRDAAG
jgi:hypothetical protein